MPYRDPERQRAAQRESVRRRRAGAPRRTRRTVEPGRAPAPAVPSSDELLEARGWLGLLAAQGGAVRDAAADDALPLVMSRARCIAFLASVALRAVEVTDLEARVAALEERERRRAEAGSRRHAHGESRGEWPT